MAKFLVTILVILLSGLLEAKPILPILLETAESASSATLGVFETGKLSTTYFGVASNDPTSPPKPLLIVTPNIGGKYPVILFHHGTYLHNNFYADLLHHVSSHGYIVVAPQFYELLLPSGLKELEFAAEVANWLSSSLQSTLPENVEANIDKIALAGHSRGGKIIFALALGYAKTSLEVNFSAVIGVDPVEGTSKHDRPEPQTLKAGSFNLSIPVAVIGTGLGEQPRYFLAPACAPKEVNHKEYFNKSRPPTGHFVTTDYGHMDMLNDVLPGIAGMAAGLLCKNGDGPKDPMRRTVGGIIVAFLKAYFVGDSRDYMTILQEPYVAPVKLDPVQFNGVVKHAQT
uniref:Chlorophyllase-1 n=1 Tax=Rhizophora mucronata TaxID=61149 RepID=A0A2P2PNQ4_RHIMU